MTELNMPLWFDWLDDDEWWEQLDVREGDDPRSWIAREVDEIIAEEENDDPSYQDPF